MAQENVNIGLTKALEGRPNPEGIPLEPGFTHT
jgi:hypothetical protein